MGCGYSVEPVVASGYGYPQGYPGQMTPQQQQMMMMQQQQQQQQYRYPQGYPGQMIPQQQQMMIPQQQQKSMQPQPMLMQQQASNRPPIPRKVKAAKAVPKERKAAPVTRSKTELKANQGRTKGEAESRAAQQVYDCSAGELSIKSLNKVLAPLRIAGSEFLKSDPWDSLNNACRSQNVMFKDEFFPPEDSSVNYQGERKLVNKGWMRFGYTCADPNIVV